MATRLKLKKLTERWLANHLLPLIEGDEAEWWVYIVVLVLFPVFLVSELLGKVRSKARKGRHWRMSDRDYAILQRKIQREKKREEERRR